MGRRWSSDRSCRKTPSIMASDVKVAETSVKARPPNRIFVGLGVLGVPALGLALWAIQPVQFKVASYTSVYFSQAERYWPPLLFALFIGFTIILLAVWSGLSAWTNRWRTTAWLLWPLVLCAPLGAFAFVGRPPPFALSFLVILGIGWAVFRAATNLKTGSPTEMHGSETSMINGSLALSYGRGSESDQRLGNHELGFSHDKPTTHYLAIGSILLFVALLTLIHTRIQLNYFEHFMLGHADIGHFTEELKNALAGRGLRSDSFDNTRLGWHFVPLMYVLVPGYALWPSPVYLMVCSGLIVHVVALPAYFLARRLSGSVLIGWLWGVAWLLLPSQGRLIYGNTYGFQWNNMTMPLLALVIVTGITHRWRWCIVWLVLLLLCRETACAAALGWGLCVALFTSRRKLGVVVALVSLTYFFLCVQVLIPHFAAAGRYERLDMFGELGNSIGDLGRAMFTNPALFFGRLFRGQGIFLLLIMVIPMVLLPLRGWRISVAALPTLIPLMLVQNDEWLGLKFWHHATILPFLFFGGIAAMARVQQSSHEDPAREPAPTRENALLGPARGAGYQCLCRLSGREHPSAHALNRGMAAAVCLAAAMGHYLYGFSPVAKVYEVYANTPAMHQSDPRLAVVKQLREKIPRERVILATERLAAHFTDYKRIITGGVARQADFVIIDRADAWDRSGLPQNTRRFLEDSSYDVYGEFSSIIVFKRRAGAPPIADKE